MAFQIDSKAAQGYLDGFARKKVGLGNTFERHSKVCPHCGNNDVISIYTDKYGRSWCNQCYPVHKMSMDAGLDLRY